MSFSKKVINNYNFKMIENLFRRKQIKEVLNQYSQNKWNQLIPIIMEIGVIYLKNNFNLPALSVEELKEILNDLKDSNYELIDEKRGRDRGRSNNPEIKNTNYVARSKSIGEALIRKPSSQWRKGEEEVNDRSLSHLRKIYGISGGI